MLKKTLYSIGIAAFVLTISAFQSVPSALALSSLDDIEAGDLIRGENFSAVYYFGEDGFRYVFPNDKTYYTWYEDFDDVNWISDGDLGTIQIGGNVTYKPGSKMIKINSDPKTYAVGEGGSLHWVSTEDVAIALYGSTWNQQIDDVSDGFFSNYSVSWHIEDADEYDTAGLQNSVKDINDDKNLSEATVIGINDNSFSNSSVTIQAGTAVRWENNGTNKHTATSDDLDWGTGTLQSGGDFSRYFDEPGTYTYFCSYHPSMTATIVVE
jgi:plastocyanin